MPWIELPLRNSPLKVKVDGDYDGEYFSQFKWRLAPNGYVYRASGRREDGEGHHWFYLARLVANPPKGVWVRYLNGDKLDCRSANLTWQTPAQSALRRETRYTPEQKSQRIRKAMTTRRANYRVRPGKFLGVSNHKSSRWIAQIHHKSPDGSRINKYLGSYSTPEAAARAFDLAEIERHGFAQAITNFPKSDYLIRKASHIQEAK